MSGLAPSSARTDGGRVLALASDPDHPLYSSWVPALGRAVEFVAYPDLNFEFPGDTVLVIASDCYHEPNVTLLQRAREAQIPTLILADGILEYRNTWEHPDLPPGSLFQPVLGHKIACIGRSQQRVLEWWGNSTHCELVGLPRCDKFLDVSKQPERNQGDIFRVLVATALNPYFTAEQHEKVREALNDIKDALAAVGSLGGRRVVVEWRVTKGLDQELGVAPSQQFAGCDLATVMASVDAVITTPSTLMLEAMLLARPVAVVDYCNVPPYVPSAWRITAKCHITEALRGLANPSPARMSFQAAALHDSLECETPAMPRMVALARAMIDECHAARAEHRNLDFVRRLLPVSPAAPRLPLNLLEYYPEASQFERNDLAALQVEVGHLRKCVAELEFAGAGLGSAALGRKYRLFAHMAPVNRQPDHAKLKVWEVTTGDIKTRALMLAPPGEVSVKLPTGESGRVLTAVCLHPDVWKKEGAGACEFSLKVDGRIIFAIALDPVRLPYDRRWVEVSLDVPASSSGSHEITFRTDAIRTPDFVWALWRDPYFVSTEPHHPTRRSGEMTTKSS